MKLSKVLTFCLLLLSFQSVVSQTKATQISFPVPTIEQEATSIWRTINDIKFFEKQGYRVHLPKVPQIDSLIAKSKRGAFGNDDYPQIYNLVERHVFDEQDYAKAIEKVKSQEVLINNLIDTLRNTQSQWNWKFKTFGRYQVVFTLYGTGGSYDPDRGIITLFTNSQGKFMNYESPANTIIHEIVHMGIEKEIVQKLRLSHGLKERVVDTIVYLLFKEKLSEYRIQNMGNPKLDDLLKAKSDIASLPKILKKLAE